MYVTIDTEMDADLKWKKTNPPQFSSVLEGVPQLMRPIWDRQEVSPIYFVSPEVVMDENCCKVLREEIRKGAIIGAHLHPEYIAPFKEANAKEGEAQFPCFAYSTEIEKEKLENLTNLIEKNLGVKPAWYRAARFGADRDTMYILKELGYQFDSSLTPHIDWSGKNGPNHSKTPCESYLLSKDDIYEKAKGNELGIKEFPVTIYGKRFGIIGKLLPDNWLFYRWLRPTHMLYLEQKGIIRKAEREKNRELVMMFHSMEVMIRKTPYIRNKFMQKYFLWRLEKTIIYAKKRGWRTLA